MRCSVTYMKMSSLNISVLSSVEYVRRYAAYCAEGINQVNSIVFGDSSLFWRNPAITFCVPMVDRKTKKLTNPDNTVDGSDCRLCMSRRVHNRRLDKVS